MAANELSKQRRIELILHQIDSLPTLPEVATRLLAVTASEDAHAREVIRLVGSDPALTARVLSLCRTADKGLKTDVLTIDRAVVLLGFSAVRNAVLSMKVMEFFGPQAPGESEAATAFDRSGFWTHSLAVATAAELLAAEHRHQIAGTPEDAFVCGLLHDIGKLALHHVLPRSFVRVVELSDLHHGNIAEFERQIIGIDHHTAGKRLAEQWGLPRRIQDCIWLHGSPFESLPRLEHRSLVALITLADTIVRRHQLGYSGNHPLSHDGDQLIAQLGFTPERVRRAVGKLHGELERRSDALGLGAPPTRESFFESIQQANEALGRLNVRLEQRGRTAESQQQVLEAICRFHETTVPGRSVQDVVDATVASAHQLLGEGFYGLLYPLGRERGEEGIDEPHWLICRYHLDGRPAGSQWRPAPPGAPDLSRLGSAQAVSLDLMAVLPWIADDLVEATDLRQVRLLPLACGWGTVALLLHDRPALPPPAQLAALTGAWGSAIAAAAQHDGARRLGEQLAEANGRLADAQERLLRQASLSRLSEMAAGAAHEMNNPLAVISGRSQLLAMTLPPGSDQQRAAQTVYQEAHRLSDLISSLHLFADPPVAERKPVDVTALLDATIQRVRSAQLRRDSPVEICLRVRDQLPQALLDGEQISRVVAELLANAIQAHPRSTVQVNVQVDTLGSTLVIQVIDDGEGMDAHTLEHALDPFFSSKPAGRRVGMGLPRAQQLVTGHGGRLDLRSRVGQGTVASVSLPLQPGLWSADTAVAAELVAH